MAMELADKSRMKKTGRAKGYMLYFKLKILQETNFIKVNTQI
jgi:hypothetical protein